MAAYGEYLARAMDPATATAWAAADAEDDDEPAPAPRWCESENIAQQYNSPSGARPEVLGEALDDARLRMSPAPYPVIGHDSTGVVGLHVDRDHTPLRLELPSDWSQDVAIRKLPSAILGAYRAALDRQYHAARIASDEEACQPVPTADSLTPLEEYRCAPRLAQNIRDDIR